MADTQKYTADLSYHNTVNFVQLAPKLEMAIVRVQYGSSFEDPKHKQYSAELVKHGVPFGAYAYCRFVSVNDAIKEADDMDKRVDKRAKFLVADVEEQTCRNPKDLIPATQAFIDRLKAKGWRVGLYTGHSFYTDYSMSKVKADFLWIPRYQKNDKGVIHGVTPDMPCHIWQYTQCGKLPGIAGNVDLNVLYQPVEFFVGKTIISKPQPTIKVTVSKTQYWQVKALVAEYEGRGFKCQGVQAESNTKVYKPGEQPLGEDAFDFVVFATFEAAQMLVIELKTKGYADTVGTTYKG